MNKYTLIIDSGTTISYIPNEIFNEIIDNINLICDNYENKKSCGNYEYHRDFGACFNFDSDEKMQEAIDKYWPTIIFILDSYKYNWRPNEYFFNATSKKGIKGCLGFNRADGKRITMGGTWMIGHEIIFDRKNQKIGIVEANCAKNINNKTENKTMNSIGIEKGYNEDVLNENNDVVYPSLMDFIFNEKMLRFYIIISIILFLVIIYLIMVLINFQKRKSNAWLWFMGTTEENNTIATTEDNNLIPVKYDVVDTSGDKNTNEKKDKNYTKVFLADPINNNNEAMKISNYNQIK